MSQPWEDYQGTAVQTETPPWEDYTPSAAAPEGHPARDFASEIPSGAELTQIGRENTPAWTEAPAQAVSELVGGMVPHDVESYAAGVFPPLAAFRQGQQLAQGDVSSIPFVGRVPEIMQAEQTPAFSKERYLAGARTLMDVALLAGMGERGPAPEGPVQAPGGPAIASEAAQWHQAVQAELQPALAAEYKFKQNGQEVPDEVAKAIKEGNDKLKRGYQPPVLPEMVQHGEFAKPGYTALPTEGEPYASQITSPEATLRYSGAPSGAVIPEEPGPPQTQPPAAPRLRSDQRPVQGDIPGAQPGPPDIAGGPEIPQEDLRYAGGEPVGGNVAGFEQVYGEGEIPAGGTLLPEDAFARAQARLASGAAKPYSFIARARTGAITPTEMGDLVAEHDRLINEAAAREGTPGYNDAYQAAKDFATNILKPAETAWHQKGMVMQIKAPIDYSRLTGFRRAMDERIGREMTPDEAPTFQKAANDVAQAEGAAREAQAKSGERVRKHYAKTPDIAFEDAANSMHEQIKKLTEPCIL